MTLPKHFNFSQLIYFIFNSNALFTEQFSHLQKYLPWKYEISKFDAQHPCKNAWCHSFVILSLKSWSLWAHWPARQILFVSCPNEILKTKFDYSKRLIPFDTSSLHVKRHTDAYRSTHVHPHSLIHIIF